MNKKNYIIIGSILATVTLAVGWLGSNVQKIPGLSHANPFVVQVVVTSFRRPFTQRSC
jgi:hypothetical protein